MYQESARRVAPTLAAWCLFDVSTREPEMTLMKCFGLAATYSCLPTLPGSSERRPRSVHVDRDSVHPHYRNLRKEEPELIFTI